MNEIDLYSAYRLPSTVKSGKVKKHKNGKHKWFLALIIIMFLVIVFFVANAFANFLSFQSISIFGNTVSVKSFNVYAISLDTFEDKTQADSLASEIKLEGAGGYIINDMGYSVLASVYMSSQDAQSVLEKVLPVYENAEIKVISISRCELQSLSSKEENKQVKNALNVFKSTYETLYSIGINLDTSQITSAEAKVQITDLLNTVSATASAFKDIATVSNDTKYKLAQAKIDQVVELLNDLVESALVSTRLSSLIKYSQISCLMLQNELSLLIN